MVLIQSQGGAGPEELTHVCGFPAEAGTVPKAFPPKRTLLARDCGPRGAPRQAAAATHRPCFVSVALDGETTDPRQRHSSPCPPTLGQRGQGPRHPTPLPAPSPRCRAGACLPPCRRLRPSGCRGVTGFRICSSRHLTLNERRFPSAGPEGKQRRKRQPGTPRLPGSSRSSGKQRPPRGRQAWRQGRGSRSGPGPPPPRVPTTWAWPCRLLPGGQWGALASTRSGVALCGRLRCTPSALIARPWEGLATSVASRSRRALTAPAAGCRVDGVIHIRGLGLPSRALGLRLRGSKCGP